MSEILIFHTNDLLPSLPRLHEVGIIALSIKTTGLDPHRDRIRFILLSVKGGQTLVIDCDSFLPNGIVLLQEILSGSSIKVFLNSKSDLPFLVSLKIFPKPLFDVTLAARLLCQKEEQAYFDLKSLAWIYLNEKFEDQEQDAPWDKPLDENRLHAAVRNNEILLRLREVMVPAIYQNGLAKIAEIEFQCVRSVAHIEYHGIYLNRKKWQALLERTLSDRDNASKILYSYTESPAVQKTFWGEEDVCGSNFDSNSFVLKLLQDNGIPVSGTAKMDLYPYREIPLVRAMTDYRKASKAITAFLQPLPELIHPVTKRLHPQYEQIVASSGRMSCWNPNIQQIPRDKSFRECFSAPPGRCLIVADYSQIELRVAAQVSNDERMLSAFQKGEDLHLLTASYLANKPMSLVSKQERQAYKAVNLGFIYGMGARGLQQTAQYSYGIDMTLEEAMLFRKRFFDTYRGVADWHRGIKDSSSGEGRTLTGRRFPFRSEAGLPERSNLPVQGTAADIIKKALGLLIDRLEGTETWIVAVVHDEILLECTEIQAEEAATILKSAMEEAVNSILPDVPTTVEPTISSSWAEK